MFINLHTTALEPDFHSTFPIDLDAAMFSH
jgi:hypothetical protein